MKEMWVAPSVIIFIIIVLDGPRNGGPSGELPPLRPRRMSGKLKGSSLDIMSVTGFG